VIPRILAGKNAAQTVRIWVPGCASGEEAYSIAMLIREQLAGMRSAPRIQIFATDIDQEALAEARRGLYPAEIAEHVSPERLARFFTRDGAHYLVTPELREMCIFSPHSLVRDPPFSGLDLVSCRNVLIYLEAELQRKLIPIFHYALKPAGYLFLGLSEAPPPVQPELFETIDKQHHIYQRIEPIARPAVEFPLAPGAPRVAARPRIERPAPTEHQLICAAFEHLVLQEYAPPAAVVNTRGDVLCVAGPTGRYLQPPVGVLTTNILNVAHASLRVDLHAALNEAATRGKSVVRDNVLVKVDDEPRSLRLTVRPLAGIGDEAKLYAVILQEQLEKGISPIEGPEAVTELQPAIVAQLESELRTTRAELSATVESLATSNEELQSSNEELQSANEELQSANEELQTSQEELKSVNEELETVNTELQRRVEELAHANNDLKNFFSASDVAILILDEELCVSRFTPAASRLFHLIEADIGRPFGDFAPRFTGNPLADDANQVLRTLVPIQRQAKILDGEAWFLLRLLPYRTQQNVIAGVVIALTDISELKRAEAELRRLATVVKDSDDAITVHDLDGHILAWNRGAVKMYGYSEDEALRMNVAALVPTDRAARNGRLCHRASAARRPGARPLVTRCHVRLRAARGHRQGEGGRIRFASGETARDRRCLRAGRGAAVVVESVSTRTFPRASIPVGDGLPLPRPASGFDDGACAAAGGRWHGEGGDGDARQIATAEYGRARGATARRGVAPVPFGAVREAGLARQAGAPRGVRAGADAA
jgi:two-component system CheB/CheR fusion protein